MRTVTVRDIRNNFAKVEWPARARRSASRNALDWADVHRFADILHVATGIHLGVETFLTFDQNQKRLAEAEGMEVPV